MSEFDPDLNPLLCRISNSPEGKKDLEGLYERHGIDPSEGPDKLASEIRLDGGNTLVNLFRGWEGPAYKEIVKDVASKLKVKIPDSTALKVNKIEEMILISIAKKYWDDLTPEERENIFGQGYSESKEGWSNFKGDWEDDAWKDFLKFILSSGLISIIIRGILARAAGVAIGSRLGLLIPGLNVILAAWAIRSITGPAYRKTVPTVVQIALLRLDYPDDDSDQ